MIPGPFPDFWVGPGDEVTCVPQLYRLGIRCPILGRLADVGLLNTLPTTKLLGFFSLTIWHFYSLCKDNEEARTSTSSKVVSCQAHLLVCMGEVNFGKSLSPDKVAKRLLGLGKGYLSISRTVLMVTL